MNRSDITKLKPGDKVKIKSYQDFINEDTPKYLTVNHEFWEACANKIFEVIKVDYDGWVKLDFREVYKPQRGGFINMDAIKSVNNISLQDDLFQL